VNFADRLVAAIGRTGNPCLVGLDPHLKLLPPEFEAAHNPAATRAERAAAVHDFLRAVIEIAAPLVPAVKPQSAFFEQLGFEGVRVFEELVREAREAGLLVIGDVKRGDIGSTAEAYADAFLSDAPSACDAITINAYLGVDGVEPFLERCRAHGKGIYVLVRTSNPSSADLQLQGEPTVAARMAQAVARWGADLVGESGLSAVGAVIGATHASELAQWRDALPDTPLLLPGYGAQGAGASDIAPAFKGGFHGTLVNSSRGILFAYQKAEGVHWKDATRRAIETMAAELKEAAGQHI